MLDDNIGKMQRSMERILTTFTPTVITFAENKNGFVAVKSLKVYHDANPLKLQELLGTDGVLLTYFMILEFIGDAYMGISIVTTDQCLWVSQFSKF